MKLDRDEVALRLYCSSRSGMTMSESFGLADQFLRCADSSKPHPAPSRLADVLEWMQEHIHKSSHGNRGTWQDCQSGMCKNVKLRLAVAAKGEGDGGDDEVTKVRSHGQAQG